MRPRHAPLPRLLLITDERLGDALWPALAALPRGAGIVFRDYGLAGPARRARYDRVRAIARRRALILILAAAPRQAAAWRADGCHGPLPHRTARPLLRSAGAHDRAALIGARRRGADLILVSPLFATRSHPGAPALGPCRAAAIAGCDRSDLVALGGMTRARARRLAGFGIQRWAAIDGLTPDGP